MHSFMNHKRAETVAKALRTMAEAVQVAESPVALKGVLLGLQEASTLINMCLYEKQKQLIEQAHYDIAEWEVI